MGVSYPSLCSSKTVKVEVVDRPIVKDEIFIGIDKITVMVRISDPVWISDIGRTCKEFEALLREHLPLKQMPSGAYLPVGGNHLWVYTNRQTPLAGEELEVAVKQFEEFLGDCLEHNPEKGALAYPITE
jgi:hypothetical protein